MKKIHIIFLLVFVTFSVSAQKKKPLTKEKDTIKTEVVSIVTSYTPKISDATKINTIPKIVLSKKTAKKKLQYTIFSAPVASTFIPKSGVVKGIDVGKKERLYNNYLAGGFGTSITPFMELFLRHSSKFNNEFGLFANYISSENSIKSTLVDSKYSLFSAGLFFIQKQRYFDWKIALKSERKMYNWYGLPNLPFTTTTIANIEEKQLYDLFKIGGELIFDDSYFNTANLSFSHFADTFKSKESLINLNTDITIPLQNLGRRFNDVNLHVSVEILNGSFVKEYVSASAISYNIITLGANPVYELTWKNFAIKAGTKLYFSADTQLKTYDFFIYPDVKISYPLVRDYLTIFAGSNGDLHTNSYENLVAQNPYISPTQFLTPTNENYGFFGGFSGRFSKNVSFTLNTSYKNEEDKVFFIRNNTKSDGTISNVAGVDLKGYEYGNSFSAYYDDVKTLSFFGALEVDVTKRFSIGLEAQYDDYTLKTQQHSWNTPNLKGTLIGKYKNDKIFITSNIFYVGERKGIMYNGTFPSTNATPQNLASYVDVNINGGYHFDDKFSVFLNLNNILGKEYQRYANFNVQGFQALAGATWKFDF